MDAPSLADIEAAHGRIKERVRQTPAIAARFHKQSLGEGELFLKLECLQVTGSFKARGATNALLSLDDAAIAKGLCTASGGNHGLACAYAAWAAGTRGVVYLPANTPDAKAETIRGWGAEVVIEGAVWDEADQAARARAEAEGMSYVPAFADPRVICGQGTAGLELIKQRSDLDCVVIAIGGGGLISGMATAIKELSPETRVIGVEPVGAPTLKRSVAAGEPVTLPSVETKAVTLAPRRSADLNVRIVSERVDDIVLVDDEQMREAARWLWREHKLATELSGAAAIAAIQSGQVPLDKGRRVAAVICGAGTDGLD